MTNKSESTAQPSPDAVENGTQDRNHSAQKRNGSPNKKQVPLLIPPALLNELDLSREASGTGLSRSSWICQAIRKELDAQK